MTAFTVLAIVFFVLGGVGVYMAFAVAMRWPPHHPKTRDEDVFKKIEEFFLLGLGKLQSLEQINATSLNAAQIPQHLKDQKTNEMRNWSTETEAAIEDLFGDEEALRFRVSPDLSRTPPHWAESAGLTDTWHNARGRIDWLRKWMQGQTNL